MRAPLDLGRLEQLARPRERPQEVGRASRLVPHLFPHERLHVGVVRRQRDDVAEIRREPAALGRATGPFDRGADRGQGPDDAHRSPAHHRACPEDRTPQNPCGERAGPNGASGRARPSGARLSRASLRNLIVWVRATRAAGSRPPRSARRRRASRSSSWTPSQSGPERPSCGRARCRRSKLLAFPRSARSAGGCAPCRPASARRASSPDRRSTGSRVPSRTTSYT